MRVFWGSGVFGKFLIFSVLIEFFRHLKIKLIFAKNEIVDALSMLGKVK
jgi:hypothetical protein